LKTKGLIALFIGLFVSLLASLAAVFFATRSGETPRVTPTPAPVCTEHAFTEWKITEAATCFVEGKETRTCTLCGETQTRAVPVLYYDFDAVDYSLLDAALDNVPSCLTNLCSAESLASLDAVRADIRSRYGKMTQEMADDCIDEFYEALASLDYPQGDTPRIYIFTNETIVKKEYRDGIFAVVDKAGGSDGNVCEPCGTLRLRGNTTGETYNKKLPYNIKFSRKVSVLGMDKAKKWALLANSFDKSLVRNALTDEFASRLNLDFTPDYRFAELYYNGEYRGSYMITENIDVAKGRVELDTDAGDYLLEIEASRTSAGETYVKTAGGVRFCVNAPEGVTAEQLAEIKSSLAEIEAALKSGDETRVRSLVDIDSFLDFYLLGELLKNQDVGFSSTRFYRKDGILYAGPVWDYDISSGNVHYTYYAEYNNLDTSGNPIEGLWVVKKLKWYDYLCRTDWFTALVRSRYLELQPMIENLYRDNSLGKSVMDTLLDEYGASFERNFTESPYNIYTDIRLGRLHGRTFTENFNYLRTWIEKRNDWLLREWNIG